MAAAGARGDGVNLPELLLESDDAAFEGVADAGEFLPLPDSGFHPGKKAGVQAGADFLLLRVGVETWPAHGGARSFHATNWVKFPPVFNPPGRGTSYPYGATMNPIIAGRVEGLLLAAQMARQFAMLDPDQSNEVAVAFEAAALEIASTDLLQRFTILPGIVPTLEVHP